MTDAFGVAQVASAVYPAVFGIEAREWLWRDLLRDLEQVRDQSVGTQALVHEAKDALAESEASE